MTDAVIESTKRGIGKRTKVGRKIFLSGERVAVAFCLPKTVALPDVRRAAYRKAAHS